MFVNKNGGKGELFPLNVQQCQQLHLVHKMWVWLSFIQTQVLIYLDVIDRKWIRKQPIENVSEEFSDFHEANNEEYNKSENIIKNNEIGNTFEIPIFPFFNNIKWGNVIDEASQVAILVSTYSKWMVMKCNDSINSIIEGQQMTTKEETPIK